MLLFSFASDYVFWERKVFLIFRLAIFPPDTIFKKLAKKAQTLIGIFAEEVNLI